MNSTNPLSHYYPLLRFAPKTQPPILQPPLKLRFHCSMLCRPNRSRRKPRRRLSINIPSEPSSSSFSSSSSYSLSTSSDAKLQTVIDLDQLYFSSRSRFHRLLASGEDAYRDLQTLIAFDSDRSRGFLPAVDAAFSRGFGGFGVRRCIGFQGFGWIVEVFCREVDMGLEVINRLFVEIGVLEEERLWSGR